MGLLGSKYLPLGFGIPGTPRPEVQQIHISISRPRKSSILGGRSGCLRAGLRGRKDVRKGPKNNCNHSFENIPNVIAVSARSTIRVWPPKGGASCLALRTTSLKRGPGSAPDGPQTYPELVRLRPFSGQSGITHTSKTKRSRARQPAA